MEEAVNLAKLGKPLMAMLFIKSYVQDRIEGRDLNEMDKTCRDLVQAILATPAVNDESWRYFIPSPTVEEIEAVIEKLKQCLE